MTEKDKVEPFPQFASWVAEYCRKAKHPFIRDAVEAVRLFLYLDQILPNRYGWQFTSADILGTQARTAKSTREVNQIYWLDFARNSEAYSVMTCWRVSELVRPAIRCLNVRELVSSAVLARSLLELSATYLSNVNIIAKATKGFNLKLNRVLVSKDLEHVMAKAIWGTRLGKPEEYLSQKNVLTTIQKLSKNPTASELLPTYEYLCEIAHPNVIGNARFWSHVESFNEDGSKVIEIGRHAVSDKSDEILDKIIWGIAWGSACTHNGFKMMEESLKSLVEKISFLQPNGF